MPRRMPFAACLGCLLLWAASAHAQRKVVVLEFDGPMHQRARGAVLESLSSTDQYAMVPRGDVESAAASAGADLGTAEGRVAVARALSLTAFVGGTVRKRGSKLEVVLTVYDGSTGGAIEAGSVRGAKAMLPRLLRAQAADKLAAALSGASPPEAAPAEAAAAPAPVAAAAEPEPEPKLKPEPAREERAAPKAFMVPAEELEPAPEADERKLAALELRLGARVLVRSFEYTDPLTDLTEHTLAPTPAGDLALRWYPGAHFGTGVAAVFGLEASGSFMLPVDAERAGVAYPTKSFGFGVGLHARIPLGAHALGGLAGYGQHAFAIDAGDDGSDPGIADVSYGFVRGGLDARIELAEGLQLAPRAAYRMLLGYGELEDELWFSRAVGGGIEAELVLRYALLPQLTIDLGGGLLRYFLTFGPEPEDPGVTRFGRIAGGAEDQQIYGTLGLTLGL